MLACCFEMMYDGVDRSLRSDESSISVIAQALQRLSSKASSEVRREKAKHNILVATESQHNFSTRLSPVICASPLEFGI
jgi:IS30 family transposase